MIGAARRYQSYRESALPWAAEFPSHWRVLRGKNLFRESTLPVRDGDGVVTCFRDGQVTLRSNRRTAGFTNAILEGGYQGVRKGQLVIHAMDAFAGAIGVSESDGKCTPEYSVCDPIDGANPAYFAMLLRVVARLDYIRIECPAVRERAPRFRYPTFANMAFPVPPPDEQAAIVRFLDHVDHRVRRYIRAKQKLIKLLEEQKQAIIHQAVTRGLDPNVRMKPSGVEWLGEVPEHWQVKRLKWVTRLQRGYDLPQDRRVPGPYPVVSSGGLIDSHAEAKAQGPGVVMGRYGSTNSVYFVDGPYWPHNTSLFVTDFQGYDPRWCFYLLRSISKADHAGKSAVPGVDRKDLFDIRVPAPPRAEGTAIAQHLDAQERSIEYFVAKVARQIASMREFGTHVVADVVTGKLDVRAAAAALPEVLDEPADDVAIEDDATEEGDPDSTAEETDE